MTRRRSLVCYLMSSLLLLAEIRIWGAGGCAMCGASCRCASQASGAACSVRSVGCGGGYEGAALLSVSPLHAVLVATYEVAPQVVRDTLCPLTPPAPSDPPRPPLDRPPRVSR